VTRWDGSAVTAGLWVAAIGQGEPQDLNLPGSYPLGYLDGHLLFAKKGGVLMAVPFDLGKGRTTGTPVRVLEGVSVIVSGAAEAALSSSGSLVYHAGAPLKQLVEVDLRGETMAAIPDQRVYLYPRYSPDGKRIAVAVESESGFDIWLYDRGSRTLSRLTTEGTLNDRPEWSPDASRILFRSNRDGDLALWTQPADGRGTPQLVVRGQDGKVWEGVFTPDGRFIIYRTGTVGTADIWIRSLAGDSTPRSLVATPFTEWAPTPSPDGRWLAYESDESGEFQVYVIPLQGPGGRRQISVDGGAEPEWSRDGTRIFYRRFDSRFMATITVDPELAVVRRDSLFSGDYASWFGHSSFDVSLDGQRLLLIAPANDSAGAVVVHNWGSELRARLGGASPAQ
jgi:serine/threonine-protein kinase